MLNLTYTHINVGNIACFNNTAAEAKECLVFFYHPDHIGNSSLINGLNGDANQHLEYTRTESVQCLPFGETLAEQQNGTSYYSPFKFSAKEKDPETGYSYFGARYYSPELSGWLSVDPMADKRPWLSAYNYCQLNPVMRVDPTGMIDIMIEDFSGGGESDGNGDPPAKSSAPKSQAGAPSGVNHTAVGNNQGNNTSTATQNGAGSSATAPGPMSAKQSNSPSIEQIVKDIYSQPIGYKITGDQIAGLNDNLGAVSNVVDNITRVKGGLQVNLTWTGRLAIKAVPNLNIPNGTVFQVKPTTLKNGMDVLRITAPGATLNNNPFGVYLNDNNYSRHGVQFFPIFRN